MKPGILPIQSWKQGRGCWLWIAVALALLAAPAARGVSGAELNGGMLTGSVRFTGTMPELPVHEPVQDPDVCGQRPRPLQSFLVATNGAVQNAIVYLAAASSNEVASPVVLDQRDCEFVPRIQVARSGAALVVRNSDPILHIVQIDALSRTNGLQPLLRLATPYAGFEKKYQLAKFREPTLLKVTGANGHDWMTAYIAVLPNPWAALTDESGKFSIRDVPAGMHRLYVWHEVLGTQTREIKVAPHRATTMDIEFAAKPPPAH